jgi:phosphatidylglycerophosphate synthase
MLDPVMRRLIDPPLNRLARYSPLSANSITALGFVCGLASAVATARGRMDVALFFLLANRFADGLDGAVARQRQTVSNFGAYADIVADFLIWSILPLSFICLSPDNAVAAAILLSSFAMSMTVFLAFAVMAEKLSLTTEAQGKKGFFYLAGLAEGTETILFFMACMIWPAHFTQLAYIFAAIVYCSVIGRIIVAGKQLSRRI